MKKQFKGKEKTKDEILAEIKEVFTNPNALKRAKNMWSVSLNTIEKVKDIWYWTRTK